MKLYVSFNNFDQPALAFLRESISPSPSIHDWRWIEWDAEIHEIPPDISLVYANDLPWDEVVRMSNLAPGKWVILVGDRSPSIGLPIVPSTFKWADLPQFAGLEDSADGAMQHRPCPARFALTMPGSVTRLGQL